MAGKGGRRLGLHCRVLVKLVEVQPDKQLFELALLRQVPNDLVHEARVVAERVRNVRQLLPCLVVATDADAVAADQVVELEDKFKDLAERDLQAVVLCSREEALLEDGVEVSVVKTDQLLKVVDLSQLSLENGPLALDHGHHHVLVHRAQKVLHLLPQELQLAKLWEVSWSDPLQHTHTAQ